MVNHLYYFYNIQDDSFVITLVLLPMIVVCLSATTYLR